MRPEFKIKRFNELSVHTLYQTLQLRSEVFVVEQNCVYQDLDGRDEKALHVIGFFEGNAVAYARLFAPGDYFESASIGRVVVSPQHRGHKWGHDLMAEAIKAIEENWQTLKITISAQEYLKVFYEAHGFVQEGNPYLEDGIPHIRMNRS